MKYINHTYTNANSIVPIFQSLPTNHLRSPYFGGQTAIIKYKNEYYTMFLPPLMYTGEKIPITAEERDIFYYKLCNMLNEKYCIKNILYLTKLFLQEQQNKGKLND